MTQRTPDPARPEDSREREAAYFRTMERFDSWGFGWKYPQPFTSNTGPTIHGFGVPAPKVVLAEQLRQADEINAEMSHAAKRAGHPLYDYGWTRDMHDVCARAKVAMSAVQAWRYALYAAAGVDRGEMEPGMAIEAFLNLRRQDLVAHALVLHEELREDVGTTDDALALDDEAAIRYQRLVEAGALAENRESLSPRALGALRALAEASDDYAEGVAELLEWAYDAGGETGRALAVMMKAMGTSVLDDERRDERDDPERVSELKAG